MTKPTSPTIPTPSRVADILEQAADLIEVHGHTRGFFENTTGQLCAVGALRRAASIDLPSSIIGPVRIINRVELYWAAVALARTAALEWPECIGPEASIYQWNDDEDLTPAKVIDTMKVAAKDLRNQA